MSPLMPRRMYKHADERMSDEMRRRPPMSSPASQSKQPSTRMSTEVRPMAARRGSALIIVVGTLALIAVIAAFYVTLGQADTRVSRGVEQGGAIDNVERQVAQHIMGIVGADRLSMAIDTVTNNEDWVVDPALGSASETDRQQFIREATDYPYTDYTKISIITDDPALRFVPGDYLNKSLAFSGNPSDAVERYRFRPAGDETTMLDLPAGLDSISIGPGDPAGLQDRRVGSDPWLASSEPTFTGRLEFSFGSPIGHDARSYSFLASQQSGRSQAELLYLDNRDLAQISNFAEDGLFVNLFNLRNNFNAESGLGLDASGRLRMSEGRTLLTIDPGTLMLRATDRLHIDPTGFGGTPSILAMTPQAFAIKNTPAWWTMNQRFMHFPADPSFQILGRDVDSAGTPGGNSFLTLQTPGHPDFPDHQYVDADGDGLYDSRWIEMTDSTLGPNGVQNLLSNDTGLRFFMGIKVIDLSSKVNVNSATDGLVPATSLVSPGATPAEIDVRRLLTMQDPSEKYVPVFDNTNFMGTGLQRLSYANIERLPFDQTQVQNNSNLVAADYERYGTSLLLTAPARLDGPGIATGRFAYDALRRAIQGDRSALHPDSTSLRSPQGLVGLAYENQVLLDITPFEFYNFDPDFAASPSRNLFEINDPTVIPMRDISRMALNRRDYWYNVGGSNIADPSDPPLTAEGFGGNLFGIEDQAELLVFHGLNDDRVLSPLERATQGRFDDGVTSVDAMTTQFGPLRANRPTSLERQHDNWDNATDPSAAVSSGDNQTDYESMALMALNPRLRLTTLSGASPLRRRAVQDINGDGILSASERRLTMEDARLDLTANPSPSELFSLYAEALLPYGYVDSTWNLDPEGVVLTRAGYNQMRTLGYGHRGSELALRISAHLAINMADMLDADDIPSVATVLTAPVAPSGGIDPRTQLDETGGQFTIARGMYSPYPWWTQNDRFDLGDDRLAPDASDVGNAGAGSDFSRTAYNVYGLEPQPFITEVSVVTVYSDVPRKAPALSSGSVGFSGDPLLSGFAIEDLESPPDFSIPYTGNDPEDRSALYTGTTFGNNCSGGLFGYDSGTSDDVNIRVDTSGDNPDLMLHVLAVQLTNPFDVAINLTDDEPAYVANPLNPTAMIPNRSFLRAMGAGVFLRQAKYYFEFNGHFFPLAEYIENMTNRNRADYVNSNLPGLYRIILEPGESRVVYVSAHASLNNLTERWRQIEEVYRGQVGDQGVLDASPLFLDTGSLSYVQNYIDDQLAVRGNSADTHPLMGDDIRYPARVVPFNPGSGVVLQSGPGSNRFVDFMRTNFAYRNIGASTTVNEIDRMRQEVRLWRKLTISDTNVIGSPEREEFAAGLNDNWIGNDLLVDRMRDPAVADKYAVATEATLDYATMDWEKIQLRDYINNAPERFDPFTAGNMFWDTNNAKTIVDVGLSMSTNDTDRSWSFWGGTNQGLTIAMRAGYRRPDHLEEPTKDGLLGEDGLAVRGLLPAWCIEGIDHNYNIAQPSELDSINGIEGPKQIALGIDDAKNGGYLGEYFGFRGCHGRDDFPNARDGARGGMFYMNFLRFVNDTKPVRNLAGFPDPAMTRVESIGYKGGTSFVTGSGVSDPMLVPTITRHPAVKYRKRELIDGVADADGDGQLDEYNDDLELTQMLQNRIFPTRNETYSAGKRTIALFSTDATLTDSEIIATVPTLMTLGRDGLGEAADPRDMTVRLGDLVMPFGVGATFAPRIPDAPYKPSDYRIGEWTTFAEAMSAALGYEPATFYTNSMPFTNPGELRYSLLSELIDAKGTRIAPSLPDTLSITTPNFQRLFVLDRGRLDLQAFAPFVNLTESVGTITNVAPQFNPNLINPTLGDYRVGFSEPPAQRLLSMGQAISRGGNPLTTPVIGTININTAADTVLRTIPGFATSTMLFSQSGLDYNMYTGVGGDVIVNPEVSNGLMEWAPGRASGKTTFFFQAQAPIPGQEFKPALGIGDPFGDYNQGFFLAGWRNVGEIPASLIAFRDRTRAEFRLAAKNAGGPGGQPPPQGGATRNPDVIFDFTPTLRLGFIPNPPISATSILELTVGNFATDFSRSSINGQGASSELPGFTGTGSLLGLSIAKADPLTSNPPDIVNPRLQEQGGPGLNNSWRLSIIESAGQGTLDRYGKDGLTMTSLDQDLNGQDDPLFNGNPTPLFTNEVAGLPAADDNFSYTLGRAGFYNENPSIQTRQRSLEDEVLDDALEELAIFNGAANTIDVRSDFFAAWFVIRGYSKEDVESLDPAEPMRPTYQKRFLMVLDRSNVTEAGQLPKVLLIREVPL